MPKMRKTDVVKRAMTGLIGDGRKTITADKLYSRVVDQCKRIGVYATSWSAFVDSVRRNGGTFTYRAGTTSIIVQLPKRVMV